MTTHDEQSAVAHKQEISRDIGNDTLSTSEPVKPSYLMTEEEKQFREQLLAVLNRIAVALEMLEGR